MNDEKVLVPREEIEEMEGLQKAHFLNANARRVNKSLGDLTGLTGLGFHIIEIEPGHETTEHHVHHYEEECVYVLEGEATAYVGEAAMPIKAGDFLGYRKGGLAHSIRNTGEKTLRCIVAGQRLPHDVADYPRQKKRIFRNEGMKWNLVDYDAIARPEAGAKK